MSLRLEYTRLREFIRRSLERQGSLIRQKGLRVTLALDASDYVRADRELMGRVFDNLLENAVKYTPDGGTVSIETRRGHELEVLVGKTRSLLPGRDRVFRRLTHVKNVLQNATIFSLYFCRLAITAHGGTLDVLEIDSVPACFRVRLPGTTLASV